MTTSPAGDAPPLARAEEVLAALGFHGTRVEAIDPEGTTAVLLAAPAERERLIGAAGAELSRRLKELGFRYVALDLDPAE